MPPPKTPTNDQGPTIDIVLSPLQVEQVVRAAGHTRGGSVSQLLLAVLDNAHKPDENESTERLGLRHSVLVALEDAFTDPGLSQSLLRGLMILASYPPDRPWRGINDIAMELGMSPSTTHRYVKTLRAVGLLEQDTETRAYRPVAPQERPSPRRQRRRKPRTGRQRGQPTI
jgi:DNA-binding MarR family transcriptional regulator